jgi:hypothetical protein
MKKLFNDVLVNILASIIATALISLLPININFQEPFLVIAIFIVLFLVSIPFFSLFRKIYMHQRNKPKFTTFFDDESVIDDLNLLKNSKEKNQIKEFSDSDPYRVVLGRRHKKLRTEYFKFTSREMADFYGFKKASHLEIFENGDKEFPREYQNELCDFFFVNPRFLTNNEAEAFCSFEVYNRERVNDFFENKFNLYFFVLIDATDGKTYPVFQKFERGFSRVIRGTLSSFSSKGVGKDVITTLIKEMIQRNIKS